MSTEGQVSAAEGGPPALFLAMGGAFSYAALGSFLRAGGQVHALLVPAPAGPRDEQAPAWRTLQPPAPPHAARALLPLLPSASSAVEPSALSLAFERGIPAYELADLRHSSAHDLLASLSASVACVACWPWRIPGAVLACYPLGVLNVHPSLLPRHRGPAPLFWTLRHGDAQAGVTIHLMDETLDTGAILAQHPVALADGVSGQDLERRCAEVGGALLARCVRALATDDLQPQPQQPGAGSYEPWPAASDFVVTGERSARWAYNFIHAAPYWGGPIVIACPGGRFSVRAADRYALDEHLDAPYRLSGDHLLLRCEPGVLHARVDPY